MRMHQRHTIVILGGLCLCILVALTAVVINGNMAHNVTDNNTVSSVSLDSEGTTHTITSDLSWSIDISSPSVVADQSTNIAIVRIESIDGANNYSELTNEYVYPYSYGQMTVLENVKGELPIDEKIEFYKMGGILTPEQHYAGLTEAQKSHYDDNQLNSLDKFHYSIAGDIDIEVGKTYLAYMKPEQVYYGKPNTYGFTCAQGGLREVDFQNDKQRSSGSNTKVLNNFTGEWENLIEVIQN